MLILHVIQPTTGVLLLARNDRSARNLARDFRTRQIEKTYLALVNSSSSRELEDKNRGHIKEPILIREDGRVELYGDRAGKSSKRDLVDEEIVRETHTEWEVVAKSQRYPVALVKIRLHTGVKHQIRIHTAQVLKAPIVGDFLYCKSPTGSIPKPVIPNPQGAVHLHASSVSLYRYNKEGPSKRFRLDITSPLPRPFREVCESANIEVPDEFRWERVLIDGKESGCE